MTQMAKPLGQIFIFSCPHGGECWHSCHPGLTVAEALRVVLEVAEEYRRRSREMPELSPVFMVEPGCN